MVATYSPLLARIDDRLIHGQVVVGCCEPMGAGRILLVDDGVVDDALQQKLYRAGVPPEIEVEICGVDDAPAKLAELARGDLLRSLVVLGGRALVFEQLRERGALFEHIQLGGAHLREGAREVTMGIFLDAVDLTALRALMEAGTSISIQPVFTAPSVRVDVALLEGVEP